LPKAENICSAQPLGTPARLLGDSKLKNAVERTGRLRISEEISAASSRGTIIARPATTFAA
jgi:hypothetical protein